MTDGNDGILVAPGDTDALVRAMEDLSARPELRTAMGLRGQKKADEFDWRRVAEKIEGVYVDVCGSHSSTVGHEYTELKSGELS